MAVPVSHVESPELHTVANLSRMTVVVVKRPPPVPDVHDRTRYVRGCRCDTCRDDHAAYMREYRSRREPAPQ